MRHIRQVDGQEHTVLMMQVENEVGIRGDSRDRSPAANEAYAKSGGHAMLFTTFGGKLMMVLHSPNGPGAQPCIFEMEDTGETLRITSELTGETP